MSESRRAPVLARLVIGLSVAACALPGGPSGGSSAPPSVPPSASPPVGSPTASPSPTAPGQGAIEHPTGAGEVVLRMEDVGGFVPIEWIAMRVPAWTLYGDGTLVVAPAQLNPVAGPTPALRALHLDEARIQEVLETALVEGGLAEARESYENVGVMDAPTTVFEIHAGNVDKSVRILALDVEEPQPGPDTPARRNFQELRVFLEGIAAEAAEDGVEYEPAGFVGVLIELEAGQGAPGEPRDWPWPDLTPADFVAPPGGEFVALPEHVLTRDQVSDAGVEPGNGGYSGIVLIRDGKQYSLVVRPQLPDEAG